MKSKSLQILCQQIHGIFASVPQRLHHFWFYVLWLTAPDNCLKFGSWQVRNKLGVTHTLVVASIGKDPWRIHQECLENNNKEFPTTYSFQKCGVIINSKHYNSIIPLLLPSKTVFPVLFIVALEMPYKMQCYKEDTSYLKSNKTNMNTLKQPLAMWGIIFPFHTLMQKKKTVAKECEFNNNMYIPLWALINIFFINLNRVIICNHKYMVQLK